MLLGAASASPLGITVQLTRTSLDVLDSLGIEVVVHNPSSASRTATFAQPSEYAIEVVRDKDVLWSSLPPSPPPNVTFAAHTHSFLPGPTPLVVYEWNGLTRGGWSPGAGAFVVRVRLLDGSGAAATVKLPFAQPLPIAGIVKLKVKEEATVSGTLDATRATLTDASGSVVLERRMTLAPAGIPIVVRGYAVDTIGGARTFAAERWALLGPPPTPAPPAPAAPPAHTPPVSSP